MKQIISEKIGGDGGTVSLVVDSGNLEVVVAYPVAAILAPLKSKIVDKLAAVIPGTWDDVIIDKAWAELIAELSDAPAAVPAALPASQA